MSDMCILVILYINSCIKHQVIIYGLSMSVKDIDILLLLCVVFLMCGICLFKGRFSFYPIKHLSSNSSQSFNP